MRPGGAGAGGAAVLNRVRALAQQAPAGRDCIACLGERDVRERAEAHLACPAVQGVAEQPGPVLGVAHLQPQAAAVAVAARPLQPYPRCTAFAVNLLAATPTPLSVDPAPSTFQPTFVLRIMATNRDHARREVQGCTNLIKALSNMHERWRSYVRRTSAPPSLPGIRDRRRGSSHDRRPPLRRTALGPDFQAELGRSRRRQPFTSGEDRRIRHGHGPCDGPPARLRRGRPSPPAPSSSPPGATGLPAASSSCARETPVG